MGRYLLLLFVLRLGVGAEQLSFSPPPQVTGGGVCQRVNCLKGSCVQSNELIPFKCDCDQGWKNLLDMPFLGCGVPDCNLNYTCDKDFPAAAPAPVPIGNSSLLDLCAWQLCGNGECVVTEKAVILPSYVCQCDKGYFNLFDSSSAMCVPQCTVGANCSYLGISLTPGSRAPSSSFNSSTTTPNAAGCVSSTLQRKIVSLMPLSLLFLSW